MSRFALFAGTQKSSGFVGQNLESMKTECLLHYLQDSEEGVSAQAKQKTPTNPTPLLPAAKNGPELFSTGLYFFGSPKQLNI